MQRGPYQLPSSVVSRSLGAGAMAAGGFTAAVVCTAAGGQPTSPQSRWRHTQRLLSSNSSAEQQWRVWRAVGAAVARKGFRQTRRRRAWGGEQRTLALGGWLETRVPSRRAAQRRDAAGGAVWGAALFVTTLGRSHPCPCAQLDAAPFCAAEPSLAGALVRKGTEVERSPGHMACSA